jgi:hypothetical protein
VKLEGSAPGRGSRVTTALLRTKPPCAVARFDNAAIASRVLRLVWVSGLGLASVMRSLTEVGSDLGHFALFLSAGYMLRAHSLQQGLRRSGSPTRLTVVTRGGGT